MPGPEESEERLGADERFEVAEGDDDLPREERTKTFGEAARPRATARSPATNTFALSKTWARSTWGTD